MVQIVIERRHSPVFVAKAVNDIAVYTRLKKGFKLYMVGPLSIKKNNNEMKTQIYEDAIALTDDAQTI